MDTGFKKKADNNKIVVCFDVDGTLIAEGHYDGTPRYHVIRHVWDWVNAGAEVWIWSQAGEDHAVDVATRLGLADIVEGCCEKNGILRPDICYDNNPVKYGVVNILV